MKEYMKPEIELIKFESEVIADNTNISQDESPDAVGGMG